MTDRSHLVILGGGFAGLTLARRGRLGFRLGAGAAEWVALTLHLLKKRVCVLEVGVSTVDVSIAVHPDTA